MLRPLQPTFWTRLMEIHRRTIKCKLSNIYSFLLNVHIMKCYIYIQKYLSRNCLLERINNFQCYELTRRCSHFLLYIDFTIDLCCVPLICTFEFFTVYTRLAEMAVKLARVI